MTSELESLNNELETTKERLSELDAIGYDGLSVAEQEEYDLLKATNEELEREYRIKEALAKVKAQEVANNARQVLSDKSEVSIEKLNYGTTTSGGRVFVDSVDSANEYLNRAEQQKQALESAKKALENYEAAYTGTAEEMVQDQSWNKLSDNIKDAETAIQETEEIIAEKYEAIEEESTYLVDSFGSVVSGCEDMYQRIAELKGRIDTYFTPEAPEIPEPNVSEAEPAAAVSQTFNDGLFTKITAATEGLDKFTSAVDTAQDAYTTLMTGNFTSGELLASIQSITSAVGEMGGKLNWEYFAETENGLGKLGDSITDLQQKYANSILTGAGIDIDSQFGQMMSNLIQNAMKTEVQLDAVNTQIDSMQQAYSDLTETIATYNDTEYITFDQLQTLLEMEPQYLACLIDENGQLQLNREAMLALANERLNDAESQAVQQAITELGKLALIDEKTAVEDNAQAFTNAVDNLAGYNAELATTIAECAVGASAIRDLNAAITGAESQDGVSDDEIQTVLNNLNTKLKLIGQTREKLSGNLGEIMGESSKDAEKAAEDAAKKYVEKFKEELAVLDQLRDSGKLSEKDYLQQLRLLYERYFRDKKEYLDEYAEYENQYLQGMKSLYASAFSAATKTISKQIDAVEDQRDAAIDAIKDEQKARQEAIEQQQEQLELQKKNLELQIKSIDKEIDAKNDEIDKIRQAREERERDIDVQKKQYALAQQKNQRTDLVYNGEQGFVSRQNDSAVRDAQEEVDKAQEEIRIGLIEKEISVLEKRKESINDQIELVDLQMDQLDEQMDKLNEYYDKLIEQTEKQFDAMISGLENTKSRWEELAELEEQAEMEAAPRQFGWTTESVLSMSDEAFQKFKLDYLGVLADIYSGNNQMLDSLSAVNGVDMSGLTGHIEQTRDAFAELQAFDLTDTGTALQSLSDGFADVSDSAMAAANAISGGSDGESSEGVVGKSKGKSSGAGNGDVVSDSFAGALKESTATAEEDIGKVASAFHSENESSVTGSVGKVVEKIGSEESENEGDLTNTMAKHIEYAIGEDGVPAETAVFSELKDVVVDIEESLERTQEILEEMDGKEYTVTVNMQGNASSTTLESLANHNLDGSVTWGNARADGGKITKPETALVSEYGQPETIVRKDGSYAITDQPTLVDLKPGDVVYNEKETKALLRGRALAGGTQDYSYLKSYDPKLYEFFSKQLYTKFEPDMSCIRDSITEINRQFENSAAVQNITNHSSGDVIINATFHIVASEPESVADEVTKALTREFQGMRLHAYQKAHER